MKRQLLETKHCPVARSVAQLMDGWTFIIVREIMLKNRRFDGLQAQSGMSPRSLTLRLKHLLENGILEKFQYQSTPKRFEYRLTEKGLEIWPILITLKQWGDKWCGPWGDDGPPIQLDHRNQGHSLKLQLTCEECGDPVDAHSGTSHLSKTMQDERSQMAKQHFNRLK